MAEITALVVNFIPVKNNFVYLHSKLLSKFKNASNPSGCIAMKHNDITSHASCYASSFNANGENAFNISTAFASSLFLEEHDTVIVSPTIVKSLNYVHVTPFSYDDWLILENSADTIQNSLLNQVRVVFAHQNLTVWVSKSISVLIHIDQLSENNLFGRLENFSEVIVSTKIRPCISCSNGISPKPGPVNSWNLSFFKDIISAFIPKVQNDDEPENCKIVETEISSLGVFRWYSTDVLTFHNISNLSTYAYNVFISKKFIENGWNSHPRVKICRLKHILYASLKSSKEDKLEKEENFFTSSCPQKIYAHVYVLEDISAFQPNSKFHKANSVPTIFISETIRNNLNCRMNSKIKLDIVKSARCNVTELNYACRNEKLDNEEIKSFFNAYTQAHDTIIVNNYCAQNFCGQLVSFSFNPLNLPYIEMCYDDVQKCDFMYVEREVENFVEIFEEPSFSSNLLNFRFYHDIIRELKSTVLLELGLWRSRNAENSIINSNHVIVEGDSGYGKSSLMKILGDELKKSEFGVHVKIVECKSLKGKLINKLKIVFECILRESAYFQPSVIIFDDLDVLFVTSKQNDSHHMEKSVSSYTNRLAAMLSDLVRSYIAHRVTVIATATNIASLESSLYNARGAAIFTTKKRLPALDEDMRRESLVQFLNTKYRVSIDELKSDYLKDVILRMEGYCIQDVSDLVDRIYFEVIKRRVKITLNMDRVKVNEEDFNKAISEIVPVSLKGVDFHKNSSITWKNVGGLDAAKELLTEILIWPSKYPKVFQQCPLKMQSGVLLYGAPGSGKTLLAGAVAGESSLNFISIKGPELLSKYVGESEEGVRKTFRRAQSAKPCILFFDEFESLAPRRGNDITGVTDRVVNQLLTELDGVESVSGVWVLAATSRPDLIDPALLRPGRLGSVVYCALPNEADRLSILKVICSTTEINENIDLKVIAEVTEGFTGADLQAVFYTAHMKQCRINQISEVANTKISMECLVEAVKETKPSLKREERLNYERIYQRFSLRDEKIGVELEKQRLTYA